jgi:hypothetical protein
MRLTISIGIGFGSYLFGARTNGFVLQSDLTKLAVNVLSMSEFTGLPPIEPIPLRDCSR